MKQTRRSLLAGITSGALSTAGCMSLGGTSSNVGTVRCSEEKQIEPAADGRLPPSTHDWPTSHHDQKRSAISPVTDVPSECAQLKWSFEAPEGPVRSQGAQEDPSTGPTAGIEYGGVSIADGTAFFPTHGAMYALDLQTGQRQWKTSLPETGLSPLTATTGTIYIGLDGGVIALDGSTGNRKWLTKLQSERKQGYNPSWITTAPTVGENNIFVGNNTGQLFAIDRASRETVWTFDAKRRVPSKEWDPDNTSDFRYTPAYSDGVLYSGSENASIYAHDAATGDLLWQNVPERPPTPCHRVKSAPTVTDDTIYVSTSCEVRAIDRADGTELWTYAGDPGSARLSPIITDGTMYVASGDYYESLGMTAVDLETRSKQWKVSGRPLGAASYADGMLYVGVSTELIAINTDSGTVSWSMPLESVVSNAPPAIIDGGVIVGDRTGVVYGIGRP